MNDLILAAVQKGLKLSARIQGGQWQYTGTKDNEVLLYITRNKHGKYTVVTNKL